MGYAKHLRKLHKTPPALRQQAAAYACDWPYDAYDWASVVLPADWLAPQPILPIHNSAEKSALYRDSILASALYPGYEPIRTLVKICTKLRAASEFQYRAAATEGSV